MDEQRIASRLQQTVPKDTTLADTSYPEPEAGDPTDHSALPLENYVLKQEVAEFLNLPRGYRHNQELVGQLESLITWAMDTSGSRTPADVLHAISRQQATMGIKDRQDKLQRLYQYVKINKQLDALYERQRGLYD